MPVLTVLSMIIPLVPPLAGKLAVATDPRLRHLTVLSAVMAFTTKLQTGCPWRAFLDVPAVVTNWIIPLLSTITVLRVYA